MFRRGVFPTIAVSISLLIPAAGIHGQVARLQAVEASPAPELGSREYPELSDYDGLKLAVLCDEIKIQANVGAGRQGRAGERGGQTFLLMTFEHLADGGLAPLTVGDFLTLTINYRVTDVGGATTNFKSGKSKLTFFYESVDAAGRLKRIKLGKAQLQFKNGVASTFLQIPTATVAKFDDVPTATRIAGDRTTKEGRIVVDAKKPPQIPADELFFSSTALFWAAAGSPSADGVPVRPGRLE